MKFDWAISRLQDMLDEADQSFDSDALELAIKSIEAWDKVRKEIEKNGQSDISAEYVLDLIDKHLIEGTTLEIEEQYLGGGRHDD